MATVSTFTADPNPVPYPSRTTRLRVTFNLDAGEPDQVLTGELLDEAGTAVASVQVTFDMKDAEPLPQVQPNPTSGAWSIRVPSGSVVPVLGQANTFDWTV